MHTILAFLGAIGLKIGLALLENHHRSSPAVLQIWEVLDKNWQIISFYAPLKHLLLPPPTTAPPPHFFIIIAFLQKLPRKTVLQSSFIDCLQCMLDIEIKKNISRLYLKFSVYEVWFKLDTITFIHCPLRKHYPLLIYVLSKYCQLKKETNISP